MKRVRSFLALLLLLAMTLSSASALAASKEATKVPTIKISNPKGTIRGGIGGNFTITPSVPGFLTLKLLDENGYEIITICDNQEVHTKGNSIEYEAVDADGNPLPEGNYVMSAVLVNQYNVSSKETTSKVKLGAVRPTLTDFSVTTNKPFKPTLSVYGSFEDKKGAEITLSLSRTNPSALYVDDFPFDELDKPGSISATLDLTDDPFLAAPAGYYTVKGAIVENQNGVSSATEEYNFVVDLSGEAYALEDAPQEVLDEIDQMIADIAAGKAAEAVKTSSKKTSSSKTSSSKTSSSKTSSSKTASSSADDDEDDSSSKKASSTSDTVEYESGDCEVGDEGYEIGVGPADTVAQSKAGYWALTSASTEDEIWAAITRDIITVNIDEKESAYIYNSPEEGRKTLGTVSGYSQGLNVIAERDDGWALVEAFRNEDGAFVRGYIRTSKLRTIEPSQDYGIVVDKATQKLTVYKDGEAIGSCDVTTGLPTSKYLYRETPAGEYILATRRGTIEYYGDGFCDNTIRFSGNYHLCEIPTTKRDGSDFSPLEDFLGEKGTRGHICVAHDASSDGGINSDWIWDLTTNNKRVKMLILDDKSRSEVPVE